MKPGEVWTFKAGQVKLSAIYSAATAARIDNGRVFSVNASRENNGMVRVKCMSDPHARTAREEKPGMVIENRPSNTGKLNEFEQAVRNILISAYHTEYRELIQDEYAINVAKALLEYMQEPVSWKKAKVETLLKQRALIFADNGDMIVESRTAPKGFYYIVMEELEHLPKKEL